MKSDVDTQPTQDTLVEVKVIEALREALRLSVVGTILLGAGAIVALACGVDAAVVTIALAVVNPLVTIAGQVNGSLGSRRTTKVPTADNPGPIEEPAPPGPGTPPPYDPAPAAIADALHRGDPRG